jgi:hypothetical protein
MLDIRSSVFNKPPEDGTLVLKHKGIGTEYEACFVICFIAF